jgi:hypothetical protein
MGLKIMGRAKLIDTTKITKLEDAYKFYCNNWSDIFEHLPTLVEYGKQVKHITELGVRTGRSTIAWLYSKPETLNCYDLKIHKNLNLKLYKEWANNNNIKFEFVIGNSLTIQIKLTDLLFIDTLHTYTQLKQELELHNNNVKNFIIIHDTKTFSDKGMDNKSPGMKQAIIEFLVENDNWKTDKIYDNNNGLTILKRTGV